MVTCTTTFRKSRGLLKACGREINEVILFSTESFFLLFILLFLNSYVSYYLLFQEEIIKHHGYPVETYTVVTEDGYILQLFRIPHGISNPETSDYFQFNKTVALLLPGMESSADDFVIGGPDQSLAFVLADNGFDVFLGNVRGSKYGRHHKTLDADRDPAFWKFW